MFDGLQVKLTTVSDFAGALTMLSTALHMVVVEKIADSASLYGCSIAQHHVCLLVKAQVRGWGEGAFWVLLSKFGGWMLLSNPLAYPSWTAN